MEVKCKICGTINDGETNFCKGCFVKLDIDKPIENNYNPKENEIEVPIEEEQEVVVPWANDDELKPISDLEKPIDKPIVEENNWVQPDLKPIEESVSNDLIDIPEIKPVQEEIENKSVIEENNQEDITIEPMFEINTDILENNFKLEDQNNLKEVIEESVEEKKEEMVEESIPEIEPEEQSEVVELSPVNEKKDEIIEPEPFTDENSEIVSESESNEISVEEETPIVVPNEVVSTIGEDGEKEIVENSIPELSDFDNWNNSELPKLDIKQFEIGDKKTDDWSSDIEENESLESKYKYVGVGNIFFKSLIYCLIFGIIFGAICIGFKYLMSNMFNMGVRGELIFIVVSSISSVATLLLAVDMTLKKTIPLASKINITSFLILLFIALPYLLIKLAYNLHVGTTLVILLILISLSIIILAIFFNYIRNNMRKKHDIKGDDKVSFIYGILSIILVIGTLVGVYMYKDKDRDISFDIIFNSESNKDMVMQYVYQVEKTISEKKQKTGYEIPNLTSDVNDALIDGKMPEEMTLYLNENGGVTSGTLVYKGITYIYDGQTIRAK